MQRRSLLGSISVAATVVIAGCGDGGDGGNESDGGTGTDEFGDVGGTVAVATTAEHPDRRRSGRRPRSLPPELVQ